MRQPSGHDAMKWIWRGSALAVLLCGWIFILFQNNFHITPPTVFVCLGYFAGVAAIYTLFRVGASVVTPNDEDDGDAEWGRPIGPHGELEREKRTLLKAIKEAEFDQQMGKLSKVDADEMIQVYRARAIEVIKELDLATSGNVGTVREQILREARARIELEKRPKVDVEKKQKKAKRADAPTDAPTGAPTGASGAATAASNAAAAPAGNDATPPASAADDLDAAAGTTSEAVTAASAESGAADPVAIDTTQASSDTKEATP